MRDIDQIEHDDDDKSDDEAQTRHPHFLVAPARRVF